jgi:dTDP-4-dehydrorhamnose reductase
MTRFLITGASGLLGLTFCIQTCRQHHVTGIVNTHPVITNEFVIIEADLCHFDSLARIVDEYKPEVIVHTAAMANVDLCETQPEAAYRLNALLPGQIAQIAQGAGIQLVHISTDAVFDGKHGHYNEEDVPAPLGVYARSKLEGEHLVLEHHPGALVARVNFYGWSLGGQRSLAEWFFNNLYSGASIKGFTDVFFCPLLVNDLVELLLRMVDLRLSGIYHVVSSECTSKYAFGQAIARRFGLNEKMIRPTSVNEGGLVAARSPDLSLSTAKLSRILGIPLPKQEEGIRRFYQQYLEGIPDKLRAMAKLSI